MEIKLGPPPSRSKALRGEPAMCSHGPEVLQKKKKKNHKIFLYSFSYSPCHTHQLSKPRRHKTRICHCIPLKFSENPHLLQCHARSHTRAHTSWAGFIVKPLLQIRKWGFRKVPTGSVTCLGSPGFQGGRLRFKSRPQAQCSLYSTIPSQLP